MTNIQMRIVAIDRSLYLVDDEDKSFRFLKRNKNWKTLSPKQNLQHKKSLNGYMRMFRDDTIRKFVFTKKGHYEKRMDTA